MSATQVRFVLHSHLPFAQLAGRRLQRETWRPTAATEPFASPMQALNRLRDEGIEPMIVLGLNQTLSEPEIDSDPFGYLSAVETTIALPRADVDEDDDDFDDDFDDDDFDDDDLEDDDLDDDDFDEEDEDYYDDDPDEGDDFED